MHLEFFQSHYGMQQFWNVNFHGQIELFICIHLVGQSVYHNRTFSGRIMKSFPRESRDDPGEDGKMSWIILAKYLVLEIGGIWQIQIPSRGYHFKNHTLILYWIIHGIGMSEFCINESNMMSGTRSNMISFYFYADLMGMWMISDVCILAEFK